MNVTKIELQEHRCDLSENRTTQMQPSDQSDNFLADDIFDSISSTPVGRLLAMISVLPEVRQEKVNEVRRQITDDNYDITSNLDSALDRVLEEFLMES